MTFDEFKTNNISAFRESEKDYFLRLSYQFKKLQRAEAHQARKELWISRLSAIAKKLVTGPNFDLHQAKWKSY